MAQADGAIDVSHVCKLTCAARKQDFANHIARAVELYECAVAAAKLALDQPDCLIVANLRSWCLATQYQMTWRSLSDDKSDDALRDAYVQARAPLLAHLLGVLETLERRHAGGTLLPG